MKGRTSVFKKIAGIFGRKKANQSTDNASGTQTKKTKTFSPGEIKIISELQKSKRLEDILFTGQYDEYLIYNVYSKEPMDDWEYEGSYFMEKDAEAIEERVIKSYGYDNCPINISIDPMSIKSLRESNNCNKYLSYLS